VAGYVIEQRRAAKAERQVAKREERHRVTRASAIPSRRRLPS
jgi:hypothetical protein